MVLTRKAFPIFSHKKTIEPLSKICTSQLQKEQATSTSESCCSS